ncbi:gag-pol fusion protein-like protein [Leptotrombidium deliense]|uniref:Gag-pol fusion protein-like protein n=1 Tax=Leptotrombidium deliense TaxID=299467 RepID=A0A443RXF8_9ACAR|nr:gag-pol fusion protein-like protein [Leptotrombidium deliense]
MGNKYIIVATDYLTKWVECRATPTCKSWEVSKFLIEQVFCCHGCPAKILSDRGTPFLSNIAKDVYEMMSTKHVKTTSYHPQTNGLTERWNREICNMISMYVSKDQTDWDVALPMLALAYVSSVHSTTGFTPFYLLYGREAWLPIHHVLKIPGLGVENAYQYHSNMLEALPKSSQDCKN